jgi:hypothetical protein
MTAPADFKEHMAKDRRLCILRVLTETNGSANDSVLHTALEAFGFRRHPRETIREDIRFLVKNGLVVDEWVRSVQIVHITQRGVDVAEGRIEVEGVKKPSIGL